MPGEPSLWSNSHESTWCEFKEARSFAREFARSLDLEYEEDWQALWKGTIQRDIEIPKDIPENPEELYYHSGWKSWKE